MVEEINIVLHYINIKKERKKMFKRVLTILLIVAFVATIGLVGTSCKTTAAKTTTTAAETTAAVEYKKIIDYPEPLETLVQADLTKLAYKQGEKIKIAYMPASTAAVYMVAVGAGLKYVAAQLGMEVVTLAPTVDTDIAGQVGMIQDAITMKVDAILLNTVDDKSSGPLVQKAVDAGIFVLNLNTDTLDFTALVHAICGYAQRVGNIEQAKLLAENQKDKKLVIGIVEGYPCYCSTERVEGFKEGIKAHPNYQIVASLSGEWAEDKGNTVATDMLQAHKDINVLYCANDQMAMGAIKAVQALGREDILILANDGDTVCLEAIAEGKITSTLFTQPYVMGEIAGQIVMDAMFGKFKGGYVDSGSVVATKDNVIEILREPEKLEPKPSKEY